MYLFAIFKILIKRARYHSVIELADLICASAVEVLEVLGSPAYIQLLWNHGEKRFLFHAVNANAEHPYDVPYLLYQRCTALVFPPFQMTERIQDELGWDDGTYAVECRLVSDKQKEKYERKIDFINSDNYNKAAEAKELGFCLDFCKIRYVHKNGFCIPRDIKCDKLEIRGGHRVTPNAENQPYKVFVFGPCTAFGAYVDDYNTIEYYMQKKIN